MLNLAAAGNYTQLAEHALRYRQRLVATDATVREPVVTANSLIGNYYGVDYAARAAAASVLARASALASGADLMLCIGSSLEVYPVAGLPAITHGGGGRLVLITQGPTPYDGDAEVKLDGDVVEELQAVLAAL